MVGDQAKPELFSNASCVVSSAVPSGANARVRISEPWPFWNSCQTATKPPSSSFAATSTCVTMPRVATLVDESSTSRSSASQMRT
jgi:hypothetical protein